MKINEITVDPQKTIPGDPLRFRIGQPIVEGGFVVEKIVYRPERTLYNKGAEIGFSCYAVNFVGIPERRLIAESVVTSIEVVNDTTTKKTVNTESSVDLPE
jgi:hypothetical protein